jgi:hypothetical protein
MGHVVDYTTFTEVDPNDTITVSSSTITANAIFTKESAFTYRNYGAGFFTEPLNHQFDCQMGSASQNLGRFGIWGVFDNFGDVRTLLINDEGMSVDLFTDSSVVTLFAFVAKGGSQDFDQSVNLSLDTRYYIDVAISSGTYTTKIYSDPTRTTLVDTLTVAYTISVNFPYNIAMSSWLNVAQTAVAYGDVSNLTFDVGSVDSSAGILGRDFTANGVNYFITPITDKFPQREGALFGWVKSNTSVTGHFFSTNDTGGTTLEHRTTNDGVSATLSWVMSNEAGSSVAVPLPSTFLADLYTFVGWEWLYDEDADQTTMRGYLGQANNDLVEGGRVVMNGKVNKPDTSFNIGEWDGTVLSSPAQIDDTAIISGRLDRKDWDRVYNSRRGYVIV